jgi:DNA-binding transcriptional ArsR family regulator
MSLGAERAKLRALAHPIRLRILSLLTGAAFTAAEVARELELTHANASYHIRQLADAGLLEPAGEEKIHGGVAKRYRYVAGNEPPPESKASLKTRSPERQLLYEALGTELRRRAGLQKPGLGHLTDAELWVDPAVFKEALDAVTTTSQRLHSCAQPPRTPGTIRVNASIVMFEMETS